MLIEKVLGAIGDKPLARSHPIGAQIIDEVNRRLTDNPLGTDATADEVAEKIFTLPPDSQEVINNVMQTYIQSVVSGVVPSGNVVAGTDYRAAIALMMSICITVMAFGVIATVCWIGYKTNVIPDWTDVAIPFMTLGFVVWNYNGVITKENRDALFAGLGNIPGGIFGGIIDALAKRRNKG